MQWFSDKIVTSVESPDLKNTTFKLCKHSDHNTHTACVAKHNHCLFPMDAWKQNIALQKLPSENRSFNQHIKNDSSTFLHRSDKQDPHFKTQNTTKNMHNFQAAAPPRFTD
jgi:hypothetical protein